MKKIIPAAYLTVLLASGMANAQTVTYATDPGHSRVNQIDQRLQNQQTRTTSGVQSGEINARQAMRDSNADSRVAQELSRDEAQDGGHITRAEQSSMNNQLNNNSTRIYDQKHAGDIWVKPLNQAE